MWSLEYADRMVNLRNASIENDDNGTFHFQINGKKPLEKSYINGKNGAKNNKIDFNFRNLLFCLYSQGDFPFICIPILNILQFVQSFHATQNDMHFSKIFSSNQLTFHNVPEV